MNVLISIPEEKLEALKTLNIIDDSTTIFYPSKELESSIESVKPALKEIQNILDGMVETGELERIDDELDDLNDDENNYTPLTVEYISKILRDASSDSEADEICIGDSYYIAYDRANDKVFVRHGDKQLEPWIYLLSTYPFSTELSAQKAIDKVGLANMNDFFNTVRL